MELVFLSSSDLHGYILPTDYQSRQDCNAPFGLSRVSSVIKREQETYGKDNVVITDSGDFLQGSPLASFAQSAKNIVQVKEFLSLYNAIDYDARCLGNHDFNYGLDYLNDCINNSRATFVNDNVLDEKTGQPAFGKDYLIVNKNGIRVGLIGATTKKVPSWEPAEHVAELRFASAFAQTKYYAQILRPQVDVLAVIYHGGFEADPESGMQTEPATGENEGYKMLTEIPEIDVFLTGHQHKKMSAVVNNTAIVQPGYRGEAVGKVVLEIDEQTKKIISKKAMLIDTADATPDSEIINLSTDLNKNTQKWLDQPIAKLSQSAPIEDANKARIEGSPFINLLQQMQLYFTGADVSATAVMSETAKGFKQEVTMRDILLNYPYSNMLCKVKILGSELRAIVEHSLSFLKKDDLGKISFAPEYQDLLFNFDVFYPIDYEADLDREVGQRLTKFELKGRAIEPEKSYYLAVNNYRAMGGGFYPCYSQDKIEEILDKDYVQMFQEFLTQANIPVDPRKNHKFY